MEVRSDVHLTCIFPFFFSSVCSNDPIRTLAGGCTPMSLLTVSRELSAAFPRLRGVLYHITLLQL